MTALRRAVLRAGAVLPPLAAALALAAGGAAAQEAPGGPRACTLVLEPATDSTRSTTVEVADGQYVTHVGNGLNWTCGDARMYADSAVKYDREQRLKAVGSVDYRDSLRTLTADTLTYHESDDRLVAEGDAELQRRDRAAALAGPRIEFRRLASGAERRTVATGRPRLTVRGGLSAGDTAGSTEIDADRIVLAGREEVRTRGDVVIRRPDVTARADSAFFLLDAGRGRLYGSPEVTGRSFTLTGRTIETGFAEGELDAVEARDSARATGEGFELLADTIRARLAERRIERLWAHGGSRSVALAPPYRLSADSLAFRFREGRLDTLRALEGAEAVEVGDDRPDRPRDPMPLAVGERSWLAADTLILSFARDGEEGSGEEGAGGDGGGPGTPADTAGADEGGEESTRVRRVRALGSARAYRVLEPREGGADGPSLHYQRGRVIVIDFEGGEAARVRGEQAIGVHLDPMAGAASPEWPPPSPPSDTAASDTAASDTTADDRAPADTVPGGEGGAPSDSAPADPEGAPADTTDPGPGKGRGP